MNNVAVREVPINAAEVRVANAQLMELIDKGEMERVWNDVKLTIGRLAAVFSICVFLPGLLFVTSLCFFISGFILAKINWF